MESRTGNKEGEKASVKHGMCCIHRTGRGMTDVLGVIGESIREEKGSLRGAGRLGVGRRVFH